MLRRCVVEAKGGAIIIHEPERGSIPTGGELAGLSKEMGVPLARLTAHFEAMSRNARYAPVMKFGSSGETVGAPAARLGC